MRGLDAGRDAETCEARQVAFVDELEMLEARRQPRAAQSLPGSLECIERRAARAIADRVDRDREPARQRARDVAREPGGRQQLHAAIARAVVGREQGGRARAQRAVREELDRADAERSVPASAREPLSERSFQAGVRNVHQHAHPRAAASGHRAQQALLLRALEIVHGGDPERQQPADRSREQRSIGLARSTPLQA